MKADNVKKTDKAIAIFYLFLVVSFVTGIIYLHYSLPSPPKLIMIQKPDSASQNLGNSSYYEEISFTRTVNINKTKFFDTISDVKSYPLVIPNRVLSVSIVNQSNNVIFANEEILYGFSKKDVLVKHVLTPYESQEVEIMNGDAKDTIIDAQFETINSTTTKISVIAKMHLKGLFLILSYLPKENLRIEMNNTLNDFIVYANPPTNKYEKIVDQLYRDILRRPADESGLKYYSQLLENGKMTEDDVKNSIMHSEEAKTILSPDSIKTVDQLNATTKKVIDGIYEEILQRPADEQGLEYYGSMLEAGKMSVDDVKKSLFDSYEYKVKNGIHQ